MENKSTNADDLKFKAKIKDWGLSHTTLEEVFMKVKDEEFYYILIAFRLRVHTEDKNLMYCLFTRDKACFMCIFLY